MKVCVAHELKIPHIPPNHMRKAERKQARELTIIMGRPDGDHRSAERIIEQSPVLKRFLDSRDPQKIGDKLKQQVGDWTEANPSLEARADATYKLDKVMQLIDNVDDTRLNSDVQIDGAHDYGYSTLNDSQASLLEMFCNKGYEALSQVPA